MQGKTTSWLRRAGLAGGIALALLTTQIAAHIAEAAAETVKLGVMGGAEEEIAEVAKTVAAGKGLTVELITFSDYNIPNAALDAGDLDANAFQHKPYLEAQIAARGYKIVPIGFTIVEPMGLYSRKIKSVGDLKPGSSIGIPNDPSNGGRALNLLAANGLITLAPGKGLSPSILDIAENPKKLKLVELEAAQLPRALEDFDAAIINTDYAVNSGLTPSKDALIQEPREGNPYGNFIAAREKDKDRPALKTLVESFQSKEVRDFLETRFKGAILPAW
ncbi:MetQ/NlpA family ABC transporter substrate-binding protein [Azospirillum sp. TSH64]|uniref:MetQ/NlpA family ABC transporter substrate-binding protein n=1 Tax=Azospirillum sp. TSH64 TaxID=652740 RepID=UPI000D6193AF|nr:MetQ/NlpA family ABC transporter substrate-binding protein [Azospirillum sp. TSH64]PWC76978.1 dioxygenase [Azospirillum sp. TSH64]